MGLSQLKAPWRPYHSVIDDSPLWFWCGLYREQLAEIPVGEIGGGAQHPSGHPWVVLLRNHAP